MWKESKKEQRRTLINTKEFLMILDILYLFLKSDLELGNSSKNLKKNVNKTSKMQI